MRSLPRVLSRTVERCNMTITDKQKALAYDLGPYLDTIRQRRKELDLAHDANTEAVEKYLKAVAKFTKVPWEKLQTSNYACVLRIVGCCIWDLRVKHSRCVFCGCLKDDID